MKYLKLFEKFNTLELIEYFVTVHTDDNSELLYNGFDLEDAEYEFNSYNTNLNRYSNEYVLLESSKRLYKYIYDDDILDYPIDDFYDDEEVYELIDDDQDREVIKEKTIEPINKDSDNLLEEIQSHYKNLYGNYKYNLINIDDINIQLRIADHTENIFNNDRYNRADYYISVVITNYDRTKDRFAMKNAFERRRNEYLLEFDGNDTKENIIEEIDNLIYDLTN